MLGAVHTNIVCCVLCDGPCLSKVLHLASKGTKYAENPLFSGLFLLRAHCRGAARAIVGGTGYCCCGSACFAHMNTFGKCVCTMYNIYHTNTG